MAIKVRLEVPVTPTWQRALARAAADRAAGRVPERIGCKTYRVPSESGGEARIVTIQSVVRLEARCTCPAGERGIVCKHAASAIDLAITRIAQAPAPEPTPGPAALTGAEVDRRMARFSRI